MKTLLISLFLLISTFIYSQDYERIGNTKNDIISEFKKYKTVVEIINTPCFIIIKTRKTEIIYIMDLGICVSTNVMPFIGKTSIYYNNYYDKKYTKLDYNNYCYNKKRDKIFIFLFLNNDDKLSFSFTKNHKQIPRIIF